MRWGKICIFADQNIQHRFCQITSFASAHVAFVASQTSMASFRVSEGPKRAHDWTFWTSSMRGVPKFHRHEQFNSIKVFCSAQVQGFKYSRCMSQRV